MQPIVIGVTGASAQPLAARAIKLLLENNAQNQQEVSIDIKNNQLYFNLIN